MIDPREVEETLGAWLIKKLGYYGPFEDDELAELTSVTARNLRDPSPLVHFTGVCTFGITGCDFRSLPFLSVMSEMMYFSCRQTPITNLEPLIQLQKLNDVEVKSCLVEDLSPLLEMPNLKWVNVIGNPLSERSYYEILPKLEEHIYDPHAIASRLKYSAENEWRITRELFERGLEIAFTRNPPPDNRPFIKAIGMDHFERPHWSGVLRLSESRMRALLEKPDLTVPEILQAAFDYDPLTDEEV